MAEYKEYSVTGSDTSSSPIHEAMSLVIDNEVGDDAQAKMVQATHNPYYIAGEGEKSKINLKYGVTNVGSRKDRYGEGTWSPNLDHTQQKKNNIDNNKPMPRNEEKILNDMNNQGQVLDFASNSIKEKGRNDDTGRKEEKDIIALDNNGQLHTLALPMTILPGN
ncbi:hypothetical protein BCR42DRAFT_433779 [Absidia repens]|uniref:Uncharacterized protein n=1 Tax=Absidia repens TaxID=90262 RepID=A0A1X2IUK6_9FUNG|nr:hypothetical protein BCR42DRAFT_433779 [Absidia repens]